MTNAEKIFNEQDQACIDIVNQRALAIAQRIAREDAERMASEKADAEKRKREREGFLLALADGLLCGGGLGFCLAGAFALSDGFRWSAFWGLLTLLCLSIGFGLDAARLIRRSI